jgi:hypothetical protein
VKSGVAGPFEDADGRCGGGTFSILTLAWREAARRPADGFRVRIILQDNCGNDCSILQAGSRRSVTPQSNMKHHFVVSRISVMTVIFPSTGSRMDFDAAAPAAVAGTDQRIPKIRPTPIVQAAGIEHFKPLTIQGVKKPPVSQLLLP